MKKKKPYRIVLYYLFLVLKAFFGLFPYRFAVWVSGMIGRITFYLLAKERNRTLGHLRLAFGGEKSEKELWLIARSVFENYGRMAAETTLVGKILPRIDEWVTFEGKEIADEVVGRGKGVIGLVAHFGNWELLGGFLTMKGYPITVIAKKIYYDRYNELLMAPRRRMGVKTIYRDDSPRKMLEVLRRNEVLGFVADQDVESVDGVFVDFFGKPAHTPVAPVRFAMATGAPIVPVFIVREGFRHRAIVEKPVELTVTGDKEKDVLANTQKWVSVQEKYIRQYPHLWVWNHRRWKTRAPVSTA